MGAVARVAGQVISGRDYSLHLGADAEFLIQPPHNTVTGAQTLTLSDRPELRVDPTVFLTTGAIPTKHAGAYGGEVVLYDHAGRLLFTGGITPARGHAGDNAGLSAVLNLINHDPSVGATTPVYGCSLFGNTQNAPQ